MCFKKSHQIVNNSIYIDSNVYKLRIFFFFVLQKVILETFAYVFYKKSGSLCFYYCQFIYCLFLL